MDGKTGMMSYAFNWTFAPPDLPYDPLESFESLRVLVSSGDRLDFEQRQFSFSILDIFTVNEVGIFKESAFNHTVPVMITLEGDASGSVQISGATPMLRPDKIVFQVNLPAS